MGGNSSTSRRAQLETCKNHGTRTATHVAEDTLELLCEVCCELNQKGRRRNRIHKIDWYVAYSDVFKTHVEDVSRNLNNQVDKVQAEIQRINQIKDSLMTDEGNLLKDIKMFVDNVIESLQQLQEKLCKDITSQASVHCMHLEKECSELQDALKKIQNTKDKIKTMQRTQNSPEEKIKRILEGRDIYSTSQNVVDSRGKHEKVSLAIYKNMKLTLEDIVSSNKETMLADLVVDNPKGNSTIHAQHQLTLTRLENITEVNDGRNDSQKKSDVLSVNKLPLSANQSKPKSESHTKKATIAETQDTFAVEPDKSFAIGKQNSFIGRETSRILTPGLQTAFSNTRVPSETPRSALSALTPSNIMIVSPRPQTHHTPEPRRKMSAVIPRKLGTLILKPDNSIHSITDSLQLEDGHWVMCDKSNKKLILLSSMFLHIDRLELRGEPYKMAKVDKDRVAITIPERRLIQFIDIKGETLSDPDILLETKRPCRGIAYMEHTLVYTAKNKVVVLNQMTGEEWKFPHDFNEPVSLLVDRENKMLYVTCIGLKADGGVVKLNFSERKVEYTATHENIKHPSCCARDSHGNLYVCDIDPPGIHLLSPEGNYFRSPTVNDYGNVQHIQFQNNEDAFIVTETNTGELNLYKLT